MSLFVSSLIMNALSTVEKAVDQVSKSVPGVNRFSEIEGWMDKGIKAAVILVISLLALKFFSMFLHRIMSGRMTTQGATLLTRWVWRVGFAIIILNILKQLGFDLFAILGAAGIAGVAIGFAAQNSLSNVISGLFLMGERSINLDDFLEVSGVQGTVEEIGLLSVTLRTLDNRQVRIPNESLLKGVIINVRRYPIRRYDLKIGVSYNEDLDKVIGVLKKTLTHNTVCLDSPEPLIVFTGFGSSSCDFLVGAWCRKEDYDELRTSLTRAIKEAFDREGIEIPFNYTVLTGGKASTPLNINVMGLEGLAELKEEMSKFKEQGQAQTPKA